MVDFPIPSRTPSRDEIVAQSDVVAAEYALPRDMMLALCIAESGEGLQSFDRWHRWTSEALEYIDNRDKDGLATILARCAAIPTNDISFGPCHQTWRWSPEYQMTGGQPYDLDAILRFRALYIENPGHALRIAAEQLRRHWTTHAPDKLEALCRYNKPNVAGGANPNRVNYQRALIRAGAEVSVPVPPEEPPPGAPMPEYRFGFKDLADRLGQHVVGAPVTEEHPFTPDDLTVQYTERGLMLYHKPSNRPYFITGESTGTVAAPPAPAITLADLRGKLPTRPGAAPYPRRNLGLVDSVDLHYTYGPTSQTVEQVAAYQVGASAQLDFPAIAYHIMVDGSGQPALCHDLDVRVWHNGGTQRNEKAVGICYTGQREPTPVQLQGIREAIRWCQEQLGRPLTVNGHKDSFATECPGPVWPGWRSLVLP